MTMPENEPERTVRSGADPQETARLGSGEQQTARLGPHSETVRFGADAQETRRLDSGEQGHTRVEPAPARPRETMRFGPGVSAATPTPAWPAAKRPARRRRRWLRVLISSLATLLLAAGVLGYLWWERQNPLEVTGAVVTPVESPDGQCDVTVDVVGTVHTNGRRGTFTYQWIRSDGETTGILTETVPDGLESTQVHLFWAFSGEGAYQATAILQILEPDQVQASADFTYRCEPAGG